MKKKIKDIASAIFSKSGYTVMPTWRLHHYPLAQQLRKIFHTFKIDCVLDVGANVGQYYDFLRDQVGYNGQIVSFEPIPDHVRMLQRRALSDKAWAIEGCALGASPGQVPFNVMNNTQFSSFLPPDDSVVGNFQGRNEVERKINVEVKTINAIAPVLKERLGKGRFYLKLDTQGFDLEVIRGSLEQLNTIFALQTEISVKSIYHGMPNYMDTIREMESLGFSIGGIYPNNPDHFPEAIEFDCIMVNTALISGNEYK